ncbi:hypothetical protein [Limnoglobus roseus]|uniref:DUF1349 domain-containing protein n=1 Tax=Limnoglobus roseus TaxID=2598579 RepID=A0A5C1AKW1_9BACT|nr:hypothetical protein [Limnoglobus roseus]QEL20019.1 hypothetical protein PX52LOC_07105 [Limnoglobus roseus]
MLRFSLLLLVACPLLTLAAPAPKDALAAWGKAIDPAKDCKFDVTGTKLKISVPGGKEPHDLSAELNAPMHAPRVMKEVEGDFQMDVTVGAFEVPAGAEGGTERNVAFFGAGFLAWQDEKNYVRLERAMFRRGDEQPPCYISFELRRNSEFVKYGTPSDGNLDPKKGATLRLKRKGNTFSAAVTEDDGKTWNELKSLDVEFDKKLQAGVIAVNTAKADFAPEFDKYNLGELKEEKIEKVEEKSDKK